MAKNISEISGIEKTAILLISLGPEKASEVFKHLKDDEIEAITLEIANTKSVSAEVKNAVMEEFYDMCIAQQYMQEGGLAYAKEVLAKSLGEGRAVDIIDKLTDTLKIRPFEFIRKTDPSQLVNFIQDEHSQTIALILAYLPVEQASEVLSLLPVEKQADVAMRIATMDRTSPEVIRQVEKVLEKKVSPLVAQDFTIAGGVDSIVDILNTIDRGTEKRIMENLETEDAELAEQIKKKMFVFEDLVILDDRAIQRVLRDVENSDIAIALKGAEKDVQDAIFNNISSRLADMIREDMELMGPVRVKNIEEAQQKIVDTVRNLEDAGEIIISKGGGDEMVV